MMRRAPASKRHRWTRRIRRTVHGYLRKLVTSTARRGEICTPEDRTYWRKLILRRRAHREITARQAARLLRTVSRS